MSPNFTLLRSFQWVSVSWRTRQSVNNSVQSCTRIRIQLPVSCLIRLPFLSLSHASEACQPPCCCGNIPSLPARRPMPGILQLCISCSFRLLLKYHLLREDALVTLSKNLKSLHTFVLVHTVKHTIYFTQHLFLEVQEYFVHCFISSTQEKGLAHRRNSIHLLN